MSRIIKRELCGARRLVVLDRFLVFLGVKPTEARQVGLMFLFSVLVVGGVVITGSVVGRSLFLAALPKSAIPLKYILPPLAMVIVAAKYSSFAARFRTERLLFATIFVVSLGIIAFRVGLATPLGTNIAYLCAVFVFLETAATLMMIQFWTFAAELFNPRQAKRLFGLIAAGGPLSSILFGALLRWLSQYMETREFLFLIVACLAGMAWCLKLLKKPPAEVKTKPEQGKEKTSLTQGLKDILDTPLLLSLTGLIVLCFIVSNISDYQLDLALQRRFDGDGQSMVGFLGAFRLWVGVAAAVVQIFLAEYVFNKLGIRAALLILPIGMGLGSLGIAATGGLLLAVALPRAVYLVMLYTINETALNLLYMPIPNRIANQVRVLIGGMLRPAAIILLGGAFLIADRYASLSLVWWSIPILVFVAWWIRVAYLASPRYVLALANSIRKRQFEPESVNFSLADETTRRVIEETLEDQDPAQVVHAIGLMKQTTDVDWTPQLKGLLEHQDSTVRVQVLSVLEETPDKELGNSLAPLLDTEDSLVRAAAIRAYCAAFRSQALVRIRPFLQSEKLPIQAAAVAGMIKKCGMDGILIALEHLKSLMASEHKEDRVWAAKVLGELDSTMFGESLVTLMSDPALEVRAAAVRAARDLGHEKFVEPLLEKLADPGIRGACIEALVAAGAERGPLFAQALSEQEDDGIQIAILKVLEGLQTPDSSRAIWDALGHCSGASRTALCHALLRLRETGLQVVFEPAKLDEVLKQEVKNSYQLYRHSFDSDLLTQALNKRLRQSHERVLAVASLLYPQLSLKCLKATLFEDDARVRAYALELLDNVLTGEHREDVLPLFSAESEDLEKLAQDVLGKPEPSLRGPLEQLSRGDDWWLRVCCFEAMRESGEREHMHALENGVSTTLPIELDTIFFALKPILKDYEWKQFRERYKERLKGTPFLDHVREDGGDENMPMADIEKLVFLRRVPLFSKLSGEELAGIVPLVKERSITAGEKFISKGADGECLYVVVDGQVTVELEGQSKVYSSPETLGELSILNDKPRSADCTALTDVLALRLDQTDFWNLMSERPEIAMGMIRVLLRYVEE